MRRLAYELTEGWRIAAAQIRANKLRSILTALGVIIGIVAVTLMGTAINGIDIGFERSLSMLGDDVLYVAKWPWGNVSDWWNYVNRPPLLATQAADLQRLIDNSPRTELAFAVPVAQRGSSVRFGQNRVTGVQIVGSTVAYAQTSTAEITAGRFFTETEANTGRAVCVLGSDVADALFPGISPLDQQVQIKGSPFTVVGVYGKQGSFLGLFSFDARVITPLNAYRKVFDIRRGIGFQVKVKDKTHLAEATDELVGAMRRVRAQLVGERDNFTVNQQEAFKQQLDPVKSGIALAGLFITGLSLFVGAIGIMNITFVSVKERTKEIGTRKALGARRRTILLQFLIEAVAICLIGGVVGLTLTFGLCLIVQHALPSLPVEFSFSLVLISMAVSVVTGVVSGFLPAWGASRLDPVVALRYE